MKPSIMRWLDWALNNARQAFRKGPRVVAYAVRFHKAGLVFEDSPPPWNADAVEVEFLCRVPPNARRKLDFALVLRGGLTIPLESMILESNDSHRLRFRFSPLADAATGELHHKSRRIATVPLPLLRESELVTRLKLTQLTLGVRTGQQVVAVPRFVAAQCRGLIATALFRSPTPLAPLVDGDIRVVFRNTWSGIEHTAHVSLSRAQVRDTEAVLAAVLTRDVRQPGEWAVSWLVNGEPKGTTLAEGVHIDRFHASLQVLDSRFLVVDHAGHTRIQHQLPPLHEVSLIGPHFLIQGDPGIAGVCRLTLYAVSADAPAVRLADQDMLLTDAAQSLLPKLIEPQRLARCTGFELRHRSRVLASLSLSPVPRASLTAEGGFKPPPEFAWTAAAEEELNERMQRLLKGDS